MNRIFQKCFIRLTTIRTQRTIYVTLSNQNATSKLTYEEDVEYMKFGDLGSLMQRYKKSGAESFVPFSSISHGC
jgi:hypothetical protein